MHDDPRPEAAPRSPVYRVLARAYRPVRFADLIGQETLVRTLTNAFRSGRLAQAYMLSGVRGVGKTTTARIIARALNCVGPDGDSGPTPDPCGECEHCRAIAEDRHVDVLEMDAASHTGVDDIRELIDGARYRPASARYKVNIIDEVHMLSKNAFNALLKTLEEPPDHVRFVFATTEIRKVPVTVLSRCQRFDLRRVEAATLAQHLRTIAAKEGVQVSEAALGVIARAADGSVRDGLSLLDQAIAHVDGDVDENAVRGMLGLADRTAIFDLFEALMTGNTAAALGLITDQYNAGADPVVILEDLIELTHWLTRLKVVPGAADDPGLAEAERTRGRQMAERLPMPELTRTWSLLLKGLGETRTAPTPVQAAEMVAVRLAYASRLPTPAEALKSLEAANPTPVATGSEPSAPPPPGPATWGPPGGSPATRPALEIADPRPASDPESANPTPPLSFRELVELAAEHGEMELYGQLMGGAHLVRFEPGCIELRLEHGVPPDVSGRLSRFLADATGARWLVGLSQEAGAPTLVEQKAAEQAAGRADAAEHPLVQAVLETFPGAEIVAVRDLAPAEKHDADDGEKDGS